MPMLPGAFSSRLRRRAPPIRARAIDREHLRFTSGAHTAGLRLHIPSSSDAGGEGIEFGIRAANAVKPVRCWRRHSAAAG